VGRRQPTRGSVPRTVLGRTMFPMTENPAPGWYPDPQNPMQQRHWNGAGWGEETRPATPSSNTVPPAPLYVPGQGAVVESKKTTAGILAIVLGGFGAHKFYLGYTRVGILQLLLTVVTCGFTAVIGLAEGIVYLTKSDEEFVATYQKNQKTWF